MSCRKCVGFLCLALLATDTGINRVISFLLFPFHFFSFLGFALVRVLLPQIQEKTICSNNKKISTLRLLLFTFSLILEKVSTPR